MRLSHESPAFHGKGLDYVIPCFFFFFQAEDGIRDYKVTGVQTCALPILRNAMTSCFTFFSMSSIFFASILIFLARIFAAVPAGTSFASSIASQAASSTSSQDRKSVV